MATERQIGHAGPGVREFETGKWSGCAIPPWPDEAGPILDRLTARRLTREEIDAVRRVDRWAMERLARQAPVFEEPALAVAPSAPRPAIGPTAIAKSFDPKDLGD